MAVPKSVPTPETPQQEVELLRARLEESNLTARRFAGEVLKRDERTMRRWLTGESPIARKVIEFLIAPRRSPWP